MCLREIEKNIEILISDWLIALRSLLLLSAQTYFVCPYDEKCKMDMSNRRFCKRCRLKKCFEIGMKREYILTEEEKVHKRQKIVENKYLKKGVSPGGRASEAK